MKNKNTINYKYLFFAILIIGAFLISYVFIFAQLEDVQYPIAELGNCESEEACKNYCEDVNNIEGCLDVARKNGLMSQQEIEEAKKVLPFLKDGTTPGRCKTKKACMAYCDIEGNFQECITFAENAGFVSKEEADMARKFGGVGPGGCKREECRDYCENPNNIEVCIEFAAQHGLIPPEELEDVRKILPLMKAGKMPGGCKSKEECEAFCNKEENSEVCVAFAIEAGFISPEDAEMIKKTGGKGPGGCKSKEACEDYCKNNQEECSQFALDHGLLSAEDAENIKKYGAGGPGGCKSEEECRAYCEANPQECGGFGPQEGELTEQQQVPPDGYPTPPAGYEGQIPPEYAGQYPTPPEGSYLTESPPTSSPPTGYIIMKVVRY